MQQQHWKKSWMFVPDDISVNHSSTHPEPDLFAHAVDDL